MNSSVLSWLRKLAADRDVLQRSGGRLFQVTGSETAKLRPIAGQASPWNNEVAVNINKQIPWY